MLPYVLFLIVSVEFVRDYRTSICVRKNEEFSLCGWKCPLTCVNMRYLNQPGPVCASKWECRVGCRCSAGFIRDEYTKNCVFVQQCPVTLMMVVLLFACILVAAVAAAPSISNGANWQEQFIDSFNLNKLQEDYRTQRSSYGSYITPCAAAAASAPIPAYAPGSTPYASASAPYSYSHAAYQVPAHNGQHSSSYYSYGNPYYRSDEEQGQEMLSLSDMNHVSYEHIPTARLSYGEAPIAQPVSGYGGGGQASGQAVGIFPNAKVGGCSVPLLVSCSPSIAHGHIVKSQPYNDGSASSYQGNLYRVVDDHLHHEEPEGYPEKAVHLSHDSKTITDKHQ